MRVLVTGSSSGFGRELVTNFLERGWDVIATLRNAEGRRGDFEGEMGRYPGKLTLLELDVRDAAQRAAIARHIDEKCGGRLDCLVNNAGYGLFGALEDLSEEQIRGQIEVNFTGLALLTRQLLPQLRAARGRIINISSVLGFAGMPLTSLYCASKFAVGGFSESLRHELAPHGVQVSWVEPGGFRTKFGDNVAWGANSLSPTSPYALQSRNYKALRDKLTAGRGTSPAPVIRAVMSLATRSRMPARVRCGRDAAVMHFLRRLLPHGFFVGLLGLAFKRIFLKPPAGGAA